MKKWNNVRSSPNTTAFLFSTKLLTVHRNLLLSVDCVLPGGRSRGMMQVSYLSLADYQRSVNPVESGGYSPSSSQFYGSTSVTLCVIASVQAT